MRRIRLGIILSTLVLVTSAPLAGLAAWLGYAGATPSGSIWMGRPWTITIKDMVDGLIYAGMTAGSFGWLWPKLAA